MRTALTMVLGALLLATLPATARGGDDDFATDVSLQRNDLRTEYRKLSREIRQVEDEIDKKEDNPTTISGRATMVWAVRETMRDDMRRLGNRRSELRARCKEIEREFRQLTAKVGAHYGKTPVWWGDLE